MSLRTLSRTALFLTPLFLPLQALAAFSDVSSTHPNAEAIAYVKAQGIVSGYADSTFKPNQTINRAEFTKIILEATQERASCASASKTFSDVPRDAWFSAYVCRGKELSMIGGYPDGTFRPGNAINLAEAAKIIAQVQRYSVTADAAVWYRGSVEALGERKAIPVSIDSFEKKLTRGEMAEMIWRLKAGVTSKLSATYQNLTITPAASSAKSLPISGVGKEYPPLCKGVTYGNRFYASVCFPAEPYLRHTGPLASATGNCESPIGCGNMEFRPWSIDYAYFCRAESVQHPLLVSQYSHIGSETYDTKKQEDMRKILDTNRKQFMFPRAYIPEYLSFVSQENIRVGSSEGIFRTFNYRSPRVGLMQLFELTVDTERSIMFIQADSFCFPPEQVKTMLTKVVGSFIGAKND